MANPFHQNRCFTGIYYKCKCSVLMFSLTNRLSVINANFTGTVDLGTSNISLYMKNLDLNYFIEAFQVREISGSHSSEYEDGSLLR
jgi:hypothetical protein